MNDAQLIDRLQATYDAVAEQTPVDDLTTVGPRPVVLALSPAVDELAHRRRGRGALLSLAACLVLVIGGVVVLAGRDDGPAADSVDALAPTLRHATLGAIPEGVGLVTIETDETRDVLVFDGGGRTLDVITDRFDAAPAVVGEVLVRGRVGALTRSPDAVELTWTERPGVTVTLAGIGVWTDDELLAIADTVVMVSDDAWVQLTARSGFAVVEPGTDRAVYDASMPQIDDVGEFGRQLRGSLQFGVGVLIGCCESYGRGGNRYVFFRAEPDVFLVSATAGTARVEIVLDGVVIADVEPVADPGLPSLVVGSVRVAGDVRDRAEARFLGEDGSVLGVETVR